MAEEHFDFDALPVSPTYRLYVQNSVPRPPGYHYTMQKKVAEMLWRGLLDIEHPVAVERFQDLDRQIQEIVDRWNSPQRGDVKQYHLLERQRKRLAQDMPPPELARQAPVGCLYDRWDSLSVEGSRFLRSYLEGTYAEKAEEAEKADQEAPVQGVVAPPGGAEPG